MRKVEENLLTLIIVFGAIIGIFIAIASVVIVYLNIDVSFVIELLIVNIDIVAIFISGSIVVVTVVYSVTTKKNLNHQILVNLRKEYGSAEMMYALQRLWTFYRVQCNEKITELKRKYGEKSQEQINNLIRSIERKNYKIEYEDKIARIKNSLSYQRRFVANFYYHLADLYILEMIPEEILFSIWSSSELDIINKIIIPLEKEQAIIDKQDKKRNKINEIKKLNILYDSCIEYEKVKGT